MVFHFFLEIMCFPKLKLWVNSSKYLDSIKFSSKIPTKYVARSVKFKGIPSKTHFFYVLKTFFGETISVLPRLGKIIFFDFGREKIK